MDYVCLAKAIGLFAVGFLVALVAIGIEHLLDGKGHRALKNIFVWIGRIMLLAVAVLFVSALVYGEYQKICQ